MGVTERHGCGCGNWTRGAIHGHRGRGGPGADLTRTLAVHWNGKVWRAVPCPGGLNRLDAVSARTAADVWAVGSSDGNALVVHWDGTTWRTLPVGARRGHGGHRRRRARGRRRLVLRVRHGARGGETVHIAHWDGSCLRPAFGGPLPRGHVGSALHGIAATEDRVVAVGWRTTVDTPYQLPAALTGRSPV
jgi:hypothetical protein